MQSFPVRGKIFVTVPTEGTQSLAAGFGEGWPA
jgi:hypothetical protein